MTSIVIAYDNRDTKIGAYCEGCKEDLIDFISNNLTNFIIEQLHSALCNIVHIELTISRINSQGFLFIAYSHGEETCLIARESAYVDGDNHHLFVNSLFYTTACSTGKKLGINLIDNGCRAFIGYDDEIEVFTNGNMPISIECDNYGIKMFISGYTIGQSFNAMKEHYTHTISRLESLGQPLLAGDLVFCRESLVFHGDPDLTINDLV